MTNKCIAFYMDNAAIINVINMTSKHPLVMILVCDPVLTSLTYNDYFVLNPHIPGVHNSVADYISHFHVKQFKKILPGVDKLPTPVPTHLLPENWSLR